MQQTHESGAWTPLVPLDMDRACMVKLERTRRLLFVGAQKKLGSPGWVIAGDARFERVYVRRITSQAWELWVQTMSECECKKGKPSCEDLKQTKKRKGEASRKRPRRLVTEVRRQRGIALLCWTFPEFRKTVRLCDRSPARLRQGCLHANIQ